MEKLIESIFSKYHLTYDYDIALNCVVMVTIEWGDWKHDHIALDYIMKENRFHLIDEITTESDGSDCYSSIHRYVNIDRMVKKC
jgi:hypothetical protein